MYGPGARLHLHQNPYQQPLQDYQNARHDHGADYRQDWRGVPLPPSLVFDARGGSAQQAASLPKGGQPAGWLLESLRSAGYAEQSLAGTRDVTRAGAQAGTGVLHFVGGTGGVRARDSGEIRGDRWLEVDGAAVVGGGQASWYSDQETDVGRGRDDGCSSTWTGGERKQGHRESVGGEAGSSPLQMHSHARPSSLLERGCEMQLHYMVMLPGSPITLSPSLFALLPSPSPSPFPRPLSLSRPDPFTHEPRHRLCDTHAHARTHKHTRKHTHSFSHTRTQ